MKKIKCAVCGRRFVPLKEAVYTVSEPMEKLNILHIPAAKQIDVIDCPQCGCQKALAVRIMRPATPKQVSALAEAAREARDA